jgi:hypothetical protein
MQAAGAGLPAGWEDALYRSEKQLRADDLQVRARIGEMLAAARMSVQAAEAAFRREALPPPSRDRPRPDPEAVRQAQVLERLGAAIGTLDGHLRALPVPPGDRLAQTLRRDAGGRTRLLEADQTLAAHAAFLRAVLDGASAGWMLENAARLEAQIAAIGLAIEDRRAVLAA